MSDTTTRGIRVEAQATYEPERSSPEEDYFFFSYRIKISNVGEETAQLLSRHWIITDADGQVEEVEGPGVVGYQPVLSPGEHFEYTSFCPLPTAVGTMHGSYRMTTGSELFEVEIAPFALAVPGAIH